METNQVLSARVEATNAYAQSPPQEQAPPPAAPPQRSADTVEISAEAQARLANEEAPAPPTPVEEQTYNASGRVAG